VQAGAQLELDQLAEILDEVGFRLLIAGTEPFDISHVKRLEVHVVLSRPVPI
jgi:hypothetical protein